jgi:hypothetical protein
MKKSKQVGVRWNAEIKSHWEKFADVKFHKDSSVLAREVLEEFLACFSTDEDLLRLGLANLTGRRPGGLLSQAILKAKQGQSDGEPKRGRKAS